MKKKIYISGKVNGEDYQQCFDKFDAAEQLFSELGFEVINPLRIIKIGTPWVEAKEILKPHLVNSDFVVFLPDWSLSKEAKEDRELAYEYEVDIVEYGDIFDEIIEPYASNN